MGATCPHEHHEGENKGLKRDANTGVRVGGRLILGKSVALRFDITCLRMACTAGTRVAASRQRAYCGKGF